MLKFFRRIRQQLLSENKFSKYLLYAIGEIFLVVIGILIALQINNWNENQKQRTFAKKLLLDIKISLSNNYEQLNFVIDYNEEGITSAEMLQNHLDSNLPYHDSLDIHFSKAIQYSTPIIRNAGYKSLANYGLNLIQNDSLLNALDDMYNMGWIETLVLRQENYFYNTASPILTELFEKVAMRTSMKPFDYEALKNSRKYHSIINTLNEYRKDQNIWYSENLDRITEIEKIIDRTLDTKK
ncbi:DUF6090 family protein [Muriicola sp. Z0-33]|uniref:DUF6090 family protein n=1 Tax=Muriicola sp. Z0-33 TaxID=2816957 RepID=UPI0022375317|nr:DUF6090 family protein [Muriicola sp. Z0-33]MCW5518168.1 hypothetical protein [Muriicola sp. Z0-33]